MTKDGEYLLQDFSWVHSVLHTSVNSFSAFLGFRFFFLVEVPVVSLAVPVITKWAMGTAAGGKQKSDGSSRLCTWTFLTAFILWMFHNKGEKPCVFYSDDLEGIVDK